MDEACALAKRTESARLADAAARIAAFGQLKRAVDAKGIKLGEGAADAPKLRTLVANLSREAGPDGAAWLALLEADFALSLARERLTEGKLTAAQAALGALRWSADPDVAALQAAVHLCAGDKPLAEVEAELVRAAKAAPANALLRVLVAEVAIAARGAAAGVEVLEGARSAVTGTLVERALASAYQRAHRGLEAKRVGFAALRRSWGAARRSLASDLGQVLALEAPPPDGRAGTPVTRRQAQSALPAPGLRGRAPVLFAHAQASCAGDPRASAAVSASIARMKRSIVADDLADALAAEQELMHHITGSRT